MIKLKTILKESNSKMLDNTIRDARNVLKNAERNQDRIDVKQLILIIKDLINKIEKYKSK